MQIIKIISLLWLSIRIGLFWTKLGRVSSIFVHKRYHLEAWPHRFRYFLEQAGPAFIKMGQLLSLQKSLLGTSLTDALGRMCDASTPMDSRTTQEMLDMLPEHIRPLVKADPIAAGSIAQVHVLEIDDTKYALKLLRKGIRSKMRADLKLCKLVHYVMKVCDWKIARQLDIKAIAAIIEQMITIETDLLMEAGACAKLSKNFNLPIRVPLVSWEHTSKGCLVMEWMDGVRIDDPSVTDTDKRYILSTLYKLFLHQVFDMGIFYADYHPGNMLYNAETRMIHLLDFGIIGTISYVTRLFLARVLIAFSHKDYSKVAKLHWEFGTIRKNQIALFEIACYNMGERALGGEISSIANLIEYMFDTIRSFDMHLEPQFLLVHKNMASLGGMISSMAPSLDAWSITQEVTQKWLDKETSGLHGNLNKLCMHTEAILDHFKHKTKR